MICTAITVRGGLLSGNSLLLPCTRIEIMPAMATACPFFEQVQGALTSSPYLSAKKFRIEAADGLVRLQGTVSTFHQKQMAQELLRRVDGVERIENQLQVSWQ